MSSFFLASKLEENEKSINSVITVFNHLFHKREGKETVPQDPSCPSYFKYKETIVEKEKEILKALGFNIYVDHPHKYVFPYLKALQVEDTKLIQHVWNSINDSSRFYFIFYFFIFFVF
jgi:cyclin L